MKFHHGEIEKPSIVAQKFTKILIFLDFSFQDGRGALVLKTPADLTFHENFIGPTFKLVPSFLSGQVRSVRLIVYTPSEITVGRSKNKMVV